jgi:hypothetical protein
VIGLPGLAVGAIAATAAAAAGLTVASLRWPLVHDAPLMHYIAARLLAGDAPYRDLFDMNLPGVYLAHVLGLVLFGAGDAGFRAFDLAVLAGIAGGLAVALARFGARAAAAAVALFWLYHVAGGAWRAGQRDLLLCLPLAWATAAGLADVARPRRWTLGLTAAALGVAVWVKPHALLLGALLPLLAWRRPPGRRAGALGLALAGLTLPGVAMVVWLGQRGGLGAFVDIVTGYLVPLYARLGAGGLPAALAGQPFGLPTLAGLGLWAGAGFAALRRPGLPDARRAVLAAGVGYGVLHYVGQGKGWEYHLYPLALFTVALGAAGLPAALDTRRRLVTGALVAGLGVATVALAAKGMQNVDPDWIRQKHARAHAAAAGLAPLVAGGGTVQVLDVTDGGIHALYLLGARQPTRFLYDFHFYHHVAHPYVRGLRAELLEGLRRRPPAAVVLFRQGWPQGDERRIQEFPELAAWLAAGYRPAGQGDGFWIYAARGAR